MREAVWLADLNQEQREAVRHGEGPLLVVAGAGSGKTRTLACRVAHLISQGIAPERILLLTFTRRAAEEMIRRALRMARFEGGQRRRVWGGTFHSVAHRLLREYGEVAGLSSSFTVLDRSDSEDLIDLLRHQQGLDRTKRRFPKKSTCLAIYSRRVNSEKNLEEVLRESYSWCLEWSQALKELFRAYVARKQRRRLLDYDDLLLYLAELAADPDLGPHAAARFDHILVDEYQDTNRLQASILQNLRRDNHNITVVGDDAQSIYSFRAAAVENMFEFPKAFPDTRIVTLQTNYRSKSPILETTNRLIAQAKNRYSKELLSARGEGPRPRLVGCRDENEQSEYVVERILAHYEEGIPLQRQAVLFRSAFLSNALEVELSRRHIPFHKYGGLRFLEAAHIKDLLSFLRIAENPRDEMAWFRVLQLADGIGPATASKIIDFVRRSGHDPRVVADFSGTNAFSGQLQEYAAMFEKIRRNDLEISAQLEVVRSCYEPLLEKRYENHEVRRNDLRHLGEISSRYHSRREFLVDLQLDPPQSTSDWAGTSGKDDDWLVLSTIHSAKGGEWDVVYLIHAADGCLPSDMSTGTEAQIEEELRLTYVAMTRSRDSLYVTWPLRYYHRGASFTDRHTFAQLCRFLTPEVVKTMESVQLEAAESDTEAPLPTQKKDLGARVRSLWD